MQKTRYADKRSNTTQICLAGAAVNTLTSHHCGPGSVRGVRWFVVTRSEQCGVSLVTPVYPNNKTTETPPSALIFDKFWYFSRGKFFESLSHTNQTAGVSSRRSIQTSKWDINCCVDRGNVINFHLFSLAWTITSPYEHTRIPFITTLREIVDILRNLVLHFPAMLSHYFCLKFTLSILYGYKM